MKRPIVAFAHHPWVEPEWMNRQQLLSRLGKRGWPVAYSTGALDWWQRGTQRWRSSPWLDCAVDRDGIKDIQPGRLGATWKRLPLLEQSAIRRHASRLRQAVAGKEERVIALLFDPQFYPYIDSLQPCDVAFHAYDVYAGQSGWTDEKSRHQSALVQRAKLVTASSKAIARHLADPKVRVLENGADVAAFSEGANTAEPDDLRTIRHPRIGYVGAINRKVDLALVARIAELRPHWQWVLVGRVDAGELLSDDYNGPGYRKCQNLPNVHLLGQKDRRDVPAYVAHMTINTMCYRSTGEGWWTAISPLKLHEYLACGQPVISAPIESVLPFAGAIDIANGEREWIESIERCLSENGTAEAAKRREIAELNSWDSRVETLDNWLQECF